MAIEKVQIFEGVQNDSTIVNVAFILKVVETVNALIDDVVLLSTEVARCKAMIQELSESHDQNRRELQAATQRARELSESQERNVSNTAALLDQVKAMRG